MSQAKIRLSQKEEELVNNAEWILTKNLIIEKIIGFFSSLQTEQKNILIHRKQTVASWIASSPKISKGEYYKGLPYVMLDYPRTFGKEGFAAIRTMFWWGNFFSVTLHLNGEWKKKMEQNIITSFPRLQQSELFFCINKNEWDHQFEEGNFLPIEKMDIAAFSTQVQEKEFIKIAASFAITHLEDKGEKLLAVFALLSEWLTD
jgi:hypothetical protein